MNFRTIRICIRKGWYYILCSVSFLLLTIISNSAKVSAMPASFIHTNIGDTIPDSKPERANDTINHPDTILLSKLEIEETKTTVRVEKINESVIKIIDNYTSLYDVDEFPCAYGPPSVIYKHRPIKRFIKWVEYTISKKSIKIKVVE